MLSLPISKIGSFTLFFLILSLVIYILPLRNILSLFGVVTISSVKANFANGLLTEV